MERGIVISGISGRFPESDNVAEFSQNLFNKIDLLTEDNRRWKPGLYGLPRKMGHLKDISKFDCQYFRVPPKQAHSLEPQARILLELTHESIIDAGYDPSELRGRNVGVFIGNCYSESEAFFFNDSKSIKEFYMAGSWKSLFPNHISYAFDFKGPSLLVDTGCASGASALCQAVRAIQNDECESAIVGACHVCLRPGTALALLQLNVLSDDGSCKSFDAAANGYARSEAVVALFIQKSDVARRNYASIVNIKTNTDGFKEQGSTVPSAAMQKQLMKEVYEECKLSPLKISYVEAHGTGTPTGDLIEMSAISEFFCSGREEPLLVGTVKSNMGHSEATASLCSIVKVIISMENSLIPPNMHFYKPNPKLKSLVDGQVKIVTNPTPWEGEYAAMNCFGICGVNVHVVLKSNTSKRKPKPIEELSIPQLALYSGRTEESVQYLFDYLQNEMPAREFFTLLHKSVYSSAVGKPYRGYKLLVRDQDVSEIKKLTGGDRPVWYIFSGMGSKWGGIDKQLMDLEVFARSIRRSAKVLEPYGLDLVDILTNEMKNESSRCIISNLVSTAAVQVALVDVLKEINITPDGIIGHSAGELCCAYADGCITAEEMVLSAYFRGTALQDSDTEVGSMAAIGMSWSAANKCCPNNIFPACNNAEDSVTISGPKESVKEFVEVLKTKNIFAREIETYGYAFHCKYIYPAAKSLQTVLEKVLVKPKPRSCRWISTSYPKQEWDAPSAKLAGASYFVHNLVSPVLFSDALHYVPKDAIVIEIAPHHQLLSVLKRAIGPDAEYIGLIKRNVDSTVHLLSSLGRLYTAGKNPDIEKLYPLVRFPVPKNTPMISPLMKWDHSESWFVAKWDKNTHQSERIIEVNVCSEESPDKYLLDHCMDGSCIYTTAGYLVLVWKALAEMKGKDVTSLPVAFEDVKFHKASVLSKAASTKFHVQIMNVGGKFEISESGMIVCTGCIHSEESDMTYLPELLKSTDIKTLPLNKNDVYKELKLRGYDYGPTFQCIIAADIEGTKGLLKWTGDWVVFLDAMLQFAIFDSPKRDLCLPICIQSLKIDPQLHNSVIDTVLKEYNGVPVFHDKNTKRIISGGAQVKTLKPTFTSKNTGNQNPLLEKYCFIPYNESKILSESDEETLETYIHVCSSVAKTILELSGKSIDEISDVMSALKEPDAALVERYLKSCNFDHVLLKYLCSIRNNATDRDLALHIKDNVNRYLSEKDNDILYQTMLLENPLRTVMDVVLENTFSRNLKIAEIADTSLPLTVQISEFVRGMLSVNYVIAHSKPDLLDMSNLPSGNFQVLSWGSKSALTFKDIDLCVIKYLSYPFKDYMHILENALATLKDNGFLLLLQKTGLVPAERFLSAIGGIDIPIHAESDLEQAFKDLNLQLVCKISDAFTSTIYLLRKYADVPYEDIVIPIIDEKYEKWIDELRDQISIASMPSALKRIWLVSETSDNTGIIGLVNCLRQEPGGSSIRCVFTSKEDPKLPEFNLKHQFYQDIVKKNLTMNVFKNGCWGSFRHLTMSEGNLEVKTQHAYLTVLNPGNLSSLKWMDSPLKYFTQSANSILGQVYYAPLNSRDIMLASGKLTTLPADLGFQGCVLGLEFSGRLENGQRVMGLVPAKGLATTVAADPNFIWEVPDDWSLEEASTVPVAYSTAYYALITRGNLRKGESVLISFGNGGVGQAAIAVALSLGCEVFIAVDSSEKREFLKKHFCQLQHIVLCNSWDSSFERYILNATNGEGVDIILNCIAKEKLTDSLNCLSQHGRFLEIDNYSLSNNTELGMTLCLKDISFLGIQLDALFENNSYSSRVKTEVVKLVKDGITSGTVRPLISTLYDSDQAEQAFRFLASDKHIGKVVLKIKDEEPQKKIIPTPIQFKALPCTRYNPEKSYVIIGGLGGFGLELCQWLVERGARHVVLTSRSGLKTGYQKLCMNRWKQANANIIVSELNAAKKDEANALLKMAAEAKPVGAIFNLALVLKDALMEDQTVENFREVCESKVTSTVNLDAASRELCPELEWFVCFSSIASGRGNAGQSNYGYANSVMERICELRTKEGLPGLAIQWGPIGDVGVIQEKMESNVVMCGAIPQRINSCLMVMDKFLRQNQPVVSSFVPFKSPENITKKASRHNALDTVSEIFGIKDMSSINPETSLGELGMDSLISVEVKKLLEEDFNFFLEYSDLRLLKIKDLKKIKGDGK